MLSFMLQPSAIINCPKIIRGDFMGPTHANVISLNIRKRKTLLSEDYFLNITKDCKNYRTIRKFISFSMSKEEEAFPIAYSMVIHEKIEMFERLLRSIYAPQNIYCVHVDAKSPETFKEAVRSIVSCFNNVFVASKLESVVYASWSRVQADLNCMEDLIKSSIQWKYLLNTCGMDFPLKTNAEIVRALKLLNGRNNLESMKAPPRFSRWFFHHEVQASVIRTNTQKTFPPIGIPMFSGSAYIVVTRDFVKYILEDLEIQKFLRWEKDTYHPDEHVWATLHRKPKVPGSIPYHKKYDVSDLHSIARLVKWERNEGNIYKGAVYAPCTGTHQHSICIYGLGDLPWLVRKHHLFAHKFDPTVDDMAIQCLEEYLRHKTLYRTEM
ncbi:PREDICTED: beta-1,3-galactosyl-O-glycosyl-glycoprotein beta-1,6-N-acetylglucosaminyltransferase 3-like [Nanorana parkeri]|uniref:beta-1,3-galactosyl-O-glycosyl-glycoprotein beta-1,6-N-acetylglucosaminyltransferase 3-like n=1 Tax=Nanorana parkeri TaxID=125878 RepID=UPI000854C371|nr:PREDICTED: beta-1,3-galactosyl-O-glycosyl-glycoprotein beta-1,6-N-acetylglucosaminyltransferase 3-like [Nanorana parkeri]